MRIRQQALGTLSSPVFPTHIQQALVAAAGRLCHLPALLLHLPCLCCQPQFLHICLLFFRTQHFCTVGLRLCSCICSLPETDVSVSSAQSLSNTQDICVVKCGFTLAAVVADD